MRNSIFLFILLSLGTMCWGQTCKPSQYDMLDWMVPQQPTLAGHYNVLYPSTGTFYWVKSSQGFPWDVDKFDSNYIYQSITEQDWNDPTTYKIFQAPLPWMPRCISIPAVAGKLASITVDAKQTWFDIHASCSSFTSDDLGYVVNEVWGPYNEAIGGLPAAPTLVLSYRYSCDSEYLSCRYKETFAMQKKNGMVQWTYYTLQNDQYVQANQTTHSVVSLAAVTPVHPCW